MADTVDELDTSVIKTWRSIVTLIVFVLTSTYLPAYTRMIDASH